MPPLMEETIYKLSRKEVSAMKRYLIYALAMLYIAFHIGRAYQARQVDADLKRAYANSSDTIEGRLFPGESEALILKHYIR